MNVMDPKHLYKSPEQDWTLPARAYTDPAMFAQERERIFFRTWQYVGHACDLRQPGDYWSSGSATLRLPTSLAEGEPLH